MPYDRTVADTHLAQWLNEQMGKWVDPETGRVGLSVNKLAKLSGVSQTTTYEILKEGNIPKADILVRFADFFEISPLVLFRLVYAPETEESPFPPEIKAKLGELEEVLSQVPTEMQVRFLEGLMSTAEMQLIALKRWEEPLHANNE